ncbi:hypothetical protein K491DRAFT_689183 [Lophiostoma macrostomum CBS 122681]|uniref:Uncharacterized protein n=1 Tax=Lophiostoma macrostomum CBS 122681 TaxID=1314788 RepID=A0A6A6THS0_9PLEO|nr:hypothetical protein K491DRAFT_689183 [Lophiostoma macrostomum CBS 122681]
MICENRNDDIRGLSKASSGYIRSWIEYMRLAFCVVVRMREGVRDGNGQTNVYNFSQLGFDCGSRFLISNRYIERVETGKDRAAFARAPPISRQTSAMQPQRSINQHRACCSSTPSSSPLSSIIFIFPPLLFLAEPFPATPTHPSPTSPSSPPRPSRMQKR